MALKLIKLLLVDDNATDRQIIINALADSCHVVCFNVETACTFSEATELLVTNNYDILLLTLNLPDSTGLETLRKIRNANPNVGVVVLTSPPADQIGLHAIQEGANYYLVKGQFGDDELIRTIRCAVVQKRAEQKIQHSSEELPTTLDSNSDFIIENNLENQKIRKAAKEWRTAFDSITDMISVTDKNFNILRVNRAFANAYKAQPQQLLGKKCYQLIHGIEQPCPNCPHKQTLETKKPVTTDFFEPHLGVHLEVTAAPVFDEDGQIYATVHIAKDITERKRIEHDRKEHDRLKSEFVVTVSHEMRTPLAIFKNVISNALAGVMGKINHKLRKNLEMANKTIDRLARIINDFLDMSKIEAGKMKLNFTQFDIQSVISDTVKALATLADEKNIELKTWPFNRRLLVNADHDSMVRVLVNLIDNAIKFTPQGGSVSIRTMSFDTTVAIEIEDSGSGIAADDLEKIFDRFVQVEKQVGPGEHGTGLGLSIAKQIVEMHHGKIEVQSKLGHGTIFTVLLPLSSQENAPSTFSQSQPNTDVSQKELTADSDTASLQYSSSKGASL